MGEAKGLSAASDGWRHVWVVVVDTVFFLILVFGAGKYR